MPSEFLLFTARQAQTLAEARALVQGLAHLLATSVRVGRDPGLLLFWLGLPDLLSTRCVLFDCKAMDLIDLLHVDVFVSSTPLVSCLAPPFALSCSQEPLSPDAPSRQVRILLDALAALSDPDGVFCVGETGDLGVRLTIARHSGDAHEAFVVRDSVSSV